MPRAETINAKLIDTSPTPTPIDSFNKANDPEITKGPLPIYGDDNDGRNKRNKLKKNKRKKPKNKRKLGWGFSWPSLPINKKERKIFLDSEKEKVKKERIKKKKEENNTPKGKKIKEKREKEKKARIKKVKEKKTRVKNKKNQSPNPPQPQDENSTPLNPEMDENNKPNDEYPNFEFPTISCGKEGWCRVELPLIGLNGLPKLSLGLIQLPPFSPNFQK